MALTLEELQNQVFSSAKRGDNYSAVEVDAFLKKVESELRNSEALAQDYSDLQEIVAVLNAQVKNNQQESVEKEESLQHELNIAQEEISQLRERPVSTLSSDEEAEQATGVLIRAQKIASDVTTEARQRADVVSREAAITAERVLEEANSDASNTINDAQAQAQQITSDAQEESTRLLSDTAERVNALEVAVNTLTQAESDVKSRLRDFHKSALVDLDVEESGN